MREIKFRAFLKGAHQRMCKVKRMQFENDQIFVAVFDGKNNAIVWGNVDGENLILMRYTGINDENGTEIYEGDVLRWSSEDNDGSMMVSNEQVIYNDGRFVMLNEKGRITDLLKEAIKYNKSYEKVELVGNIYENKELMEG